MKVNVLSMLTNAKKNCNLSSKMTDTKNVDGNVYHWLDFARRVTSPHGS